MFIFSHLVVVLAVVLHVSCVLSMPVPFAEVEKAWKAGRSERDIHATDLSTPSFFHSVRATAIQNQVKEYMESFDSALDERTMSAPWKGKLSEREGLAGLGGLATKIQDFMDRKLVEWMEKGQLEGGDEAPILRPRTGRRWEF